MKTLKNVLLVNAISSAATALVLLAFPGFLAEVFGISQTAPFTETGIFLLLFATYVFFQSRKPQIQGGRLRFIISIDVLWVVGSLLIIVPQLFGLSLMGYLLIGGVAAWVAAMAFLQARGLKQLS